MVLAEMLKRMYREEGRRQGLAEIREEGRLQGIEEGREEAQQIWEAWYERLLAARRAGLPFDELPPSRNRTPSDNGT